MRFLALGSIAFAAGSASAQGLFDFGKPDLVKRDDSTSETRYDSCGIPLRSTWSRHGKYSKHSSASKKRSCEERRAAYYDPSALVNYSQTRSARANGASGKVVKANKAASASAESSTWQAPSETNTWQPAPTQANTWSEDSNTWEASSQPADTTTVAWNQNAQQQQNTWTETQNTWTQEASSTNTWSADQDTWSSSEESQWSSSAPAWTPSSSSEAAWSSSSAIDWNQANAQQQADTTSTQQWTNTWTSSSEWQPETTTTEWTPDTTSTQAAESSSSSSQPQLKFRIANVQQQADTTSSANNWWQPAPTSSDDGDDWTSSSEAAAATTSAWTPPASTGNSYGKRGLAWAVDDAWAPTIATGNIHWAYHWQDDYISTLPSSVEQYPMLYSGSQSDISKFYTAVNSMPSTPKYILGPNEPDIPSQSNMTPEAAAAAWKAHMEPYADKGSQLCTPAVAYKLDWLQQFMDACDGCRISCVAIHSYDDYDPNYATLKQRVEDTHNAFPEYDIWVTEFGLTSASNPSSEQVVQYLQSASDYMEGLDYVKKYAFFGAWASNPDGYASSNSAFFDFNGALSAVGKWYADN